MANVTEIQRRIETLTRQIETARRDKAAAEGALAEVVRQLKERHGVGTAKAAMAKAEELERKADDALHEASELTDEAEQKLTTPPK